MAQKPIPIAYTFGNHMHWVDMEWLWGYDVLPGSVDDMLNYCRTAGVKGCINFDGIGYEKMAAECPEHLAKLREAVQEGTIEVVGGSYGQPYGLFQGGESNIRQRIYGVRSAIRLLGVRPRTFWEEEFDFYPQLPQLLAGCGFTGASLYFQWTWHTPEVPMEDAPVVLWEGIDGTPIPTATRNRLNLHQWPEDFRILLDDLATNPPNEGEIPPLVLQWLELMPTPDWMCRSELMLPMLAELREDPRFTLVAETLGEYLARWKDQELPVRRYSLDDVWHGMTLGKNGDNHPKQSATLEHQILAAETASAILGLFGRPYEPWDVYPTWELEECWRKLLAAQHHDNHECEGLCGHVAEAQFAFIGSLLSESNPVERLAKRVGTDIGFNRLGQDIQGYPAVGYRALHVEQERMWEREGHVVTYAEGDFYARIDLEKATILELRTPSGTIKDFPLRFSFRMDGEPLFSELIAEVEVDSDEVSLTLNPGRFIKVWFNACPESGELEITVSTEGMIEDSHIDPGYSGAIKMHWGHRGTALADSPYGCHEVGSGSSGRRKYPEGDWMTSPQWFESVEGMFTSQSFVRTDDMLIAHSGAQQWVQTPDGLEAILLSYDPWDEANADFSGMTVFRISPGGVWTPAESKRRGNQLCGRRADVELVGATHPIERSWLQSRQPSTSDCRMPSDFSAVRVHAENVLATAFYREQSSYCGRGLENYAGQGISHPYILRLVEYNGEAGDVDITLPGPIATAYKTNLMGEIIAELQVTPDDPALLTSEPDKLASFGIEAVRITLPMRPHEIATLYLDIVPGRKQFRDLDAKREIWATVHRTDE